MPSEGFIEGNSRVLKETKAAVMLKFKIFTCLETKCVLMNFDHNYYFNLHHDFQLHLPCVWMEHFNNA